MSAVALERACEEAMSCYLFSSYKNWDMYTEDDGNPDSCLRYTFAYENPQAGEGRFIHTYQGDGNPLPSFAGEPKKIAISGEIDAFTDLLWNSLNEENKVSLFVRYIDIASGAYETRIVNKNQQ